MVVTFTIGGLKFVDLYIWGKVTATILAANDRNPMYIDRKDALGFPIGLVTLARYFLVNQSSTKPGLRFVGQSDIHFNDNFAQ